MEELININDYISQQLPHYVKFTADFLMKKSCVYKEDIHTNLYQVLSKMTPEYKSQNSVLMAFRKEILADNDRLLFSQIGQPDYNYQNGFNVEIRDNHIRLEYFELRQDSLILPNVGNFLSLLITIIEAIELQTNDISMMDADVQFKVNTNTKVALYNNNSPFALNLVQTITYYATDNTILNLHLEKQDVMFNIVRRFYQLFKSETPCTVPYSVLNKEQFEIDYGKLWQG